MFFACLILWIIFNGKLNVEILLFGIVISFALELLRCKLNGRSLGWGFRHSFDAFLYIGYLFMLLLEIIVSGMKVIWLILHPKYEVKPRLEWAHFDIKSENRRVLLANSITLTPGTISVFLSKDRVRVHALDAMFIDGIETSRMLRSVERLDEKYGTK